MKRFEPTPLPADLKLDELTLEELLELASEERYSMDALVARQASSSESLDAVSKGIIPKRPK